MEIETQPVHNPVWETLPLLKRRFIQSAVISAFAQLILVDIWFRFQELSLGSRIVGGDGIISPVFDLSAVVYAGVVTATVLLVVRSNETRNASRETLFLGNAWMLASLPLVLDNLIDTFEVKIPVIILFVIVGLRYWKGIRNSYLSLVLAPFVAFIVAGDGLSHLQGSFCGPTGLDACSVKAVSDTYLLMITVLLTYLTVSGRDRRPELKRLIAIILIVILLLVGFLLLP